MNKITISILTVLMCNILYANTELTPTCKKHAYAEEWKEARKACENEANQGVLEAQYIMWSITFYGYDGYKSYNEAFKWASLGAKQDHPEMMDGLGLSYQYGWGTSIDQEKAKFWFEQSASRGYYRSHHNLAEIYRNKKEYRKAYENYLVGYKKHSPESTAALAGLYMNGQGVKQDIVKAYILAYEAKYFGDDVVSSEVINHINQYIDDTTKAQLKQVADEHIESLKGI